MDTGKLSTCNILVMWRLVLNEEESKQEFETSKTYPFTTVGNASIPLDIPIDFRKD